MRDQTRAWIISWGCKGRWGWERRLRCLPRSHCPALAIISAVLMWALAALLTASAVPFLYLALLEKKPIRESSEYGRGDGLPPHYHLITTSLPIRESSEYGRGDGRATEPDENLVQDVSPPLALSPALSRVLHLCACA